MDGFFDIDDALDNDALQHDPELVGLTLDGKDLSYDEGDLEPVMLDKDFVKDKNNYNELVSVLQRQAQGVLRKPVVISEAKEGHVAYTSRGTGRSIPIAIARQNSFYDGATKDEGTILRLGLLCHEVMHQCMTPFDMVERRAKQMDEQTANVFHFVHNVLEDPAIEHFCDQFVTSKMEAALKFTIKWGYDHGPELGQEKSAWEQYVNRLIQYGDMGPQRGEWTFPEAKEMFMKTVDLFTSGINEVRGKERIKIAARLTEMTRPLWEKDANAMSMMKRILKGRGDAGAPGGNGMGSNRGGNDPCDPDGKSIGGSGQPNMDGMSQSAKDKLRDAVRDSMKANRESALERLKEKGTDAGEGKSAEADKDKDGQSTDQGQQGQPFGSDKDGKDANGQSNQRSEKGTPGKQTEQHFHEADRTSGDYSHKQKHGTAEEASEYDRLLQEAAAEADKETLDSLIDIMNKQMNHNEPAEHSLTYGETNMSSTIPGLDEYSCENKMMPPADYDSYSSMVDELQSEITILTKYLDKIFRADEGKAHTYTYDGEYSVRRHMEGVVTSRMFEKHRRRSNKRDMCISLCIDHSGSMHGGNIEAATKAAIVLTEACAKLNIPCYVMGYNTAGRSNATHYHYIQWDNKPQDRCKLANMPYSAGGCNFDAYSLKYMTDEVMKNRRERHQILFAISDGQPTDGFTSDNIADVANVIEAAREKRNMDVVGISIGHQGYGDGRAFKRMYGDGYVRGDDVGELPHLLAEQLKKVVNGWGN